MGKQYQAFLKTGIDLTPVGAGRGGESDPCFCTPRGAGIIGWAGVDGIHFCFIRDLGEMVFAVSPMNSAPHFVHPVARDFADFLRLLLACGDSAALEQAWMWDNAQFETFLQENPATEEQKRTLSEIAEKMRLTAMEQPWAYIRALQSSFDYSRIKYTEDYYDMDMNPAAEPAAPEWRVYFDGSFWGHQGKEHAGKEIPIGKQFEWAGRHWLIPAAYACSKGIVVDFCMRVEADEIRAFMKKWNLTQENDSCESFTHEQQMELKLDNPLCLNFTPKLELNGHELRASHGCAVAYNPCLPEGMAVALEAKWTLEHYNLDAGCGWVVCRKAFPWASKRRPGIKTLSLTMEQQPSPMPGPRFTVKAPGDSFRFIHPVSRVEYTLTVQEVERQTLPENAFRPDRWTYPNHYTAMSYTLFPETEEYIAVSDCDDGDRAIEKEPRRESLGPTATHCALMGVIGGADGPTAIVFGGTPQSKLRAACSALHFEPVQHEIQWRITFHARQFPTGRFALVSEK